MMELILRPFEQPIDVAMGDSQSLPRLRRRQIAKSDRAPAHRSLEGWSDRETDPDAERRCSDALSHLLASRGDPAAEIDGILADHPDSVFAHCLRLALIVRDDDRAAQGALAASVAAITAAGTRANRLAHRHAAAATLWLAGGDTLAHEGYAALVAEQPRDAIALAVAHALDFRLGHRRMLRNRVASAIRHWDESMPGYAAILAMHGFGLEENGEYRRAERVARRALALDPGLVPAIHVLAHVMEMEGRAREGLTFLAAHEGSWADGSGFAVHIAWHRALFHLQLDDVAAALAGYDAQIANPAAPTLTTLADASALLWRLHLRDIDVGARWRHLADRWEETPLAEARPFFRVHAMAAFAAAGRRAAATRLLESLPPFDISDAAQISTEQALARPVCEALLAFAARDYTACIDALGRVSHIADRCGGSLAQCKLSQLTFVEATRRAQQMLWAA